MSTTKTTQKTLTDASVDDHTTIDLNEIVARTTPVDGEFPTFDEFSTICNTTKDSLERVIAAEVDRT
ncbi:MULTISPECIES: hypothetical protein [unclassified Natrinema]|uniref:hypothetical protein n=1 Tax=unclassified Natrinema TaxID=2622230 RepID=UPI00026D4859|nr:MULTISPECIES: hypothetical protein [unclassified Natrinema]AFO57020.1 hypothetical protein NJ7G_1777 [Natrinema sp. J7-2]